MSGSSDYYELTRYTPVEFLKGCWNETSTCIFAEQTFICKTRCRHRTYCRRTDLHIAGPNCEVLCLECQPEVSEYYGVTYTAEEFKENYGYMKNIPWKTFLGHIWVFFVSKSAEGRL